MTHKIDFSVFSFRGQKNNKEKFMAHIEEMSIHDLGCVSDMLLDIDLYKKTRFEMNEQERKGLEILVLASGKKMKIEQAKGFEGRMLEGTYYLNYSPKMDAYSVRQSIESVIKDKKTIDDPVTKENFHFSTQAIFSKCEEPKTDPNFISKSGSKYWYVKINGEDCVVRHSNHWDMVKSCVWLTEKDVECCAYVPFSKMIQR